MRKRSNYRPKGVRLDVMNWVLSGMKPLRAVADEAVKLKLRNHGALLNVTQGRGTRDDLDVLIAAMNMTEALVYVREELGMDWRAEIGAGQDALLTMTRRGVDRGDRFVFMGPELTAVNLAMEIHDAQLDQCTVAELERALAIVRDAIRNNKATVI